MRTRSVIILPAPSDLRGQKNNCPLGGTGEMVQRLRVLAALAEDLGPVPSTCMTTHNSLCLLF